MLTDFPKAKTRALGYDYRCKDCTKFKNSKYFKENKEYFSLWAKINKDKVIKKVLKWANDNREKVLAHKLLNQAIKSGEIKRGKCAVCCNNRTDGHHPNYKKPLEVIWLCRQHHRDLHTNLT